MIGNGEIVIVGASLAGAKAAETLREEGFDGRIVLISTHDDRLAPVADRVIRLGDGQPRTGLRSAA